MTNGTRVGELGQPRVLTYLVQPGRHDDTTPAEAQPLLYADRGYVLP
jgi:hypothetical protein